DDVGEIDAAPLQLTPYAAAILVGPRDARVLRAQAEPRARAHGGRRLAAAEDLLLRDPHLREGAKGLRIAGQQVDEVDGIRPETDDVPSAFARRASADKRCVRHRR